MKRFPIPTSRGWIIIGGGVALFIAGAALGFVDLIRAGAFALLLALGMWLVVRLAVPSGLAVRRTLLPSPPRVDVSSDVAVELESPRSSWLPATITEGGNTRPHEFNVSRVESGTSYLDYSYTPRTRGRWDAGPLTVSLRDPLGLMRVDGRHGDSDAWLVWPQVEQLDGSAPVMLGDGEEALPRLNVMNAGVPGAGIREYTQGDDIRLVHWAATAHRGELMVRQLEPPARPALILALAGHVDGFGSDDGFEFLVRAMASTVSHFAAAGTEFEARIGDVTTRDRDTAMDELAQVTQCEIDASIPGDRTIVAFVHSTSTLVPAPPRQYAAVAVVSGPDARATVERYRAAGWSALAVRQEVAGNRRVADVMNPLIHALEGAR